MLPLDSFYIQLEIVWNIYWFCAWYPKNVNVTEDYLHPLKEALGN